MDTWQTGVAFRETLRAHAARGGRQIDEARLDEICTPSYFIRRLGCVFERLEKLV
jgi:adenylosuccinate lyase